MKTMHEMKCADARPLFASYLDKSLTVEQRLRLEEHLRLCPKCAQDVSELKQVVEELRSLEVLSPPSDIRRKVRSALLQERHARTRRTTPTGVFEVLRSWRAHARSALSYTGLGLASATLVFILLLTPKLIRERPELPMTYVRPPVTARGSHVPSPPQEGSEQFKKKVAAAREPVSLPPTVSEQHTPTSFRSPHETTRSKVRAVEIAVAQNRSTVARHPATAEAGMKLPEAAGSTRPSDKMNEQKSATDLGRRREAEAEPTTPEASSRAVAKSEAPQPAVTAAGTGAPSGERGSEQRSAFRAASTPSSGGTASAGAEPTQQDTRPGLTTKEEPARVATSGSLLELASFEVSCPATVEPRLPFDLVVEVKPREDISQAVIALRLPVQVALIKAKETVSGGEHEVYTGALRADQITRLKLRLETLGEGTFTIRISVASREPRSGVARKLIEINSAEK